MIQDIEPMHLYNQYHKEQIQPGDYVLVFCEKGVLVKSGEKLVFPTCDCFADDRVTKDAIYLFSLDEKRFFLVGADESVTLAEYGYRSLHEIRQYEEKELVLVAATGFHLYVWYHNNHFCGRCGRITVHDDKERMLRCSCGNMIFPKVAPAVIVAVVQGDFLLLTRYANRTYKKYALVAGFTEIGETVEETVRREVMEEVRIRVKNIRYYKSQPWGFDSNLLLGFFCEADGDVSICVEEEELAEARWIARKDVPDYGEGLSLTHEMMQVFREGREKEFLAGRSL